MYSTKFVEVTVFVHMFHTGIHSSHTVTLKIVNSHEGFSSIPKRIVSSLEDFAMFSLADIRSLNILFISPVY